MAHGERRMVSANAPQIHVDDAEDFSTYYANSVQIEISTWDFSLKFGQMTKATESQIRVRNEVGIFLSPQQAKALLTILKQNVESYEEIYGCIALEPKKLVVPAMDASQLKV